MSEPTKSPGRIEGKVALITGGGSGLGREVSLLFAREGAHVVVTDSIDSRARDVAAEIGKVEGHQPALAVTVDVSDEHQVENAVDEVVKRFGRLDIMHTNAGVGVPGQGGLPFEDTLAASWDAVNDVNFKGVFFCMKHAAKAMRESGGGSIIATSSAAAFVGYPGMSIYAAGKGGVNSLVRAAAFDLGKYGIRVNAVCPTHGMSVNFGLPKDAPVVGLSWEEAAGDWDPLAAPMPLKLSRPPRLIDNAYPVLFLASDEAEYMSGVCIPTTDGGTMSRTAIPFPPGWSLEERVEACREGIDKRLPG